MDSSSTNLVIRAMATMLRRSFVQPSGATGATPMSLLSMLETPIWHVCGCLNGRMHKVIVAVDMLGNIIWIFPLAPGTSVMF